MKLQPSLHSLLASIPLIFVLTATSGCGGSQGGGADSPEAVFQKAKTAMEKEDFETFSNCMTPETQDAAAAALAFAGIMMKNMGSTFSDIASKAGASGSKSMDEAKDAIGALLEKHGISETAISSITTTNQDEAIQEIIKPIKDKAAFMSEMLEQMSQVGDDKSFGNVNGDLIDLKVEGDSATGTLVSKKNGAEEKRPIKFEKSDGSWKIALSLTP